MASRRTTRILCAADPHGSTEALDQLVQAAAGADVDAVVVVGDLSDGEDASESYRSVFKALGKTGLPAYWVPGPDDAPVAEYLREAHNMEVVFPLLHGVHGTAAVTPDGHTLVAGLGGSVGDDPGGERDESEHLNYPRWEAEYRLKILREFDELQMVLLFATPPAHKGHGRAGSETLSELVGTHRPRLVVTGGERGTELIGRSLVVAPGSLADGHYAIADLHSGDVQMAELATAG
jgi:Icc-related predicted phosphoesterase